MHAAMWRESDSAGVQRKKEEVEAFFGRMAPTYDTGISRLGCR